MSYYSYLPYTIKLHSSVILTSPGGDPNSSSTFTYISGSSVRGVVAARLGNPDRGSAIKKEFDDLVLGGKARYLNAYPRVNDDRAMPIPVSLKKKKGVALSNQTVLAFDLAAFDVRYSGDEDAEEHWPTEPLQSLGADYISMIGADALLVQPRQNSRIHHQRDRQKGRATEDNGAIFTFESLEADQEFAGMIQLRGSTEEELVIVENRIRKVLTEEGTLLFGRSRRAAYGGMASIVIGKTRIREISDSGKEGLQPLSDDVNQNQQFRVLLTSPCIVRNPETGQVDPTVLERVFLERFEDKVKLCRKRWSFELIGGFNRKWGLELPQTLAVSAGSVLVFEAIQPLSLKKLLELEHEGLGERKAEGFGRFVFLDQPLERIALGQHSNKPEYDLCSGERPSLVAEIEFRMLQKAIARKIEQEADNVVSRASNCPTNSLIGRLRALLREHHPTEAVGTQNSYSKPLKNLTEWLDEKSTSRLKKTAMDQLTDCKIRNSGSLHSWLQDAMNKDNLNKWLKLDSLKRQCSLGEDVKTSENHKELSVKLIDAVLAAMAIRNKLKEERNGN
jgi:CRISPR-associated protein Csx10